MLLYEKLNEKIETRIKLLHFAMINVTLPAIMIPNLIMSFFIYFTSDSSSEAFRLAFPIWYKINKIKNLFFKLFFDCFFLTLRFPFEWRTPYGYLIPFSIQFAAVYFIVLISEFNICFLLGSCETLQTLSVDIKNDLVALDDLNKTGTNPSEVRQKMCDFVDLLSDTRQLSKLK